MKNVKQAFRENALILTLCVVALGALFGALLLDSPSSKNELAGGLMVLSMVLVVAALALSFVKGRVKAKAARLTTNQRLRGPNR